MDATPASKSELLALIRTSGARLDAALAALDESQMDAPGVIAGHSVKDLLAHITTWEERLLEWIARWRATGDPQRPEPGRRWDEIDAINDRDFAAKRALPLEEVLRAAQEARARVLTEIDGLPEPDLVEERAAWDGLALAYIVRANTDEHYDEHLAQIEAWLEPDD